MILAQHIFFTTLTIIVLMKDIECQIVATTESLQVDTEDDFNKIQVECLLDTHVAPDLILKLKSGDWKLPTPTQGAYTTARKYLTKPPVELQKWTLCLLVKSGIMSKQGVFKMDVALSRIHPNRTIEVEHKIDLCLPKKDLLPHQIAWLYLKCYNHENPKKLTLL